MVITRRRAGFLPAVSLLLWSLLFSSTLLPILRPPLVAAQDAPVPDGRDEASPEGPAIAFAEDFEGVMMEEAARMRAHIEDQARSLFERAPLGFDFDTLDRLREWAMVLPLKLPALAEHVLEQSRLLGFVGSLIMLAFLVAVFYSLFWQKRVLDRLERAVEPLRRHIPDGVYPYGLSLLKIVVASLMPLLLFGVYSLIQAFITYRAPWFLITGRLLMLWALGALIMNLLREALTQDLLPIQDESGRSIFRVGRIVLLYILFSMAVILSAEAFEIPGDFLALLKFILSLSIVFVALLLLLKKKSILGILPELPYRSYEIFTRGLARFYFPAMFLTFLTGILWCVGYQALCRTLWVKTWAVAGAFMGIMLAYHLLQGWLKKWLARKGSTDEQARTVYQAVRSLLLYATVTAIFLVTFELLGLLQPVQRVLSFPVMRVGQAPLSLWTLLRAALILLAFVFISRLIRSWLDYKIYPSIGVDEGLAYAINTFISYLLVVVGALFALRAVGIDLRVLMVFAGAVGIGLGLGLQNMASNLISGISLVFGRRIRKGDWIQVGDTLGAVLEVSLRATKVRTRDNVEYLIPNAELTSNTIVNYTLSDPTIRIHVPVGVSYSADPKAVERILIEVAKACLSLSRERRPEVWFTEYGDSSINFELLVWIDVRRVGENQVRSQLYYPIFEALAAAGIEIPFPQRDLHLRSGFPVTAPDGRD